MFKKFDPENPINSRLDWVMNLFKLGWAHQTVRVELIKPENPIYWSNKWLEQPEPIQPKKIMNGLSWVEFII